MAGQTVPGDLRIGAWAAVGVAVLLAAAGYLLGLWAAIWWFDGAIHAYMTFAVTLLVASYLYGASLTGARSSPVWLVVTIALVGIGLGGAWEIAEWAFDQWLASGNFRLSDTVVDLILDGVGAAAAGVVLLLSVR